MNIMTIDGGTTNTRMTIVDGSGKILYYSRESIGVRDTASSGSISSLKDGLHKMFLSALRETGLDKSAVRCILASGMITSEMGLMELPHLDAPCTSSMLAKNMRRYRDTSVFPSSIPVYFIRGIKNPFDPESGDLVTLDSMDFMRGEETQVVGLLEEPDIRLPACVVILSSHTKFISIDTSCTILGSITTLSGQVFDALTNHTILGKSLPSRSAQPVGEINETIVAHAYSTLNKYGFLRSLLQIRFMDTLLESSTQERQLFTESLLAAEDFRCLSLVGDLYPGSRPNFILIGPPNRCRVYKYILETHMGITPGRVHSITDTQAIDLLSIRGALALAKLASLI